ncbi:MAG: DedA family protein [Xanthomonadaceae bacterium]|nr:DedA family protein [Xanthomonadaceae bacterium]
MNFYGPTPYLIIFGVLLACGLGVPIPEDITLFAAGLMAYYGVSDLYLMIAVSLVGVMMGDSIIFWLGRTIGSQLTKKWFFAKLLPPDRLDHVGKLFQTRGNKLLFAARFMPGLRAPVFFSAGVLKVPFKTFFFYDGSAALISVPLIIGAVYKFGDELDQVVRVIKKIEGGIVIVIAVVILGIMGKWYFSRKRKIKEA